MAASMYRSSRAWPSVWIRVVAILHFGRTRLTTYTDHIRPENVWRIPTFAQDYARVDTPNPPRAVLASYTREPIRPGSNGTHP